MLVSIIDPDWLWVVQISAFLILYLMLHLNFLWSIVIAHLIYCLIGGWRFMKVLFLTAIRDLHGLRALIRLRLGLRRMVKNNMGIPDLFVETATKYPNKLALMSSVEGDKWTFNQLENYSNMVAHYFLNEGYRSGDVIALFMESRPIYVATWLGMAKAGIVPALINFNLRMDSLEHCIKVAEAKAVVFGAELSDAMSDIWEKLRRTNPELKIYFSSLFCSPHPALSQLKDDALSLDQLVSEQIKTPPFRYHHVNLSDPLIFVYTSGTTGMPKAAVVSHSRYFIMSRGMNFLLRTSSDDIFYVPLPLYHTAGGILGVGACLMQGNTLFIRPKFSASKFWDECAEYECTVVQYIGELCRYLLAQPIRPSETRHRVRLALGNGIRPQIWREFQARFKVAQIGEFYGATESNCNIVNSENKVGAVGFTTRILPCLYPITLIKMDPETGEPIRNKNGICVKCRPNEPGQLVGKIIKGDLIRHFDGYVNTTGNSKKVVDNVFKKGDKGFLSGDILEMDELGYFYFRDRVGDTYRWRGENVSTAEVESVISSVISLADVVVYGVEIPNVEGRAGMAAIVDPEHRTDLNLLSREMAKILPNYARPVFIRFCDTIEMTGTFKLKKIDLLRVSYNPNLTNDRLFILDSKTQNYQPLDHQVYNEIQTGQRRF